MEEMLDLDSEALISFWDVIFIKFRSNHKKIRVYISRVEWVLEIASNLYRVSGSVSKLITTVIQKKSNIQYLYFIIVLIF
jgi:hypothetical protein